MNKMLRDYQQEMMDRLEEAWTRYRSVMVQMPTGTGKTLLMAEVIRKTLPRPRSVREGSGVLIVTHRRELVEQIKGSLPPAPPEGKGDGPEVIVTSIQKLSRTDSPSVPLGKQGAWKPSLVIVDEAHHALAKTYRKLWEWWPEAKFLGLTATPCRLSGEAFTDLFDTLLQSWTIQEFIDKGWLSDFDYVSAAPDSEAMRLVAALNKRGADGDYQAKQMATVMDVPESVAHLYDTYKAFMDGKKGIVYAIDRQHAQHIAAYYQERGVRAAVIDSKTPAAERKRMIEEYKKNTLPGAVLVNVDIFSEGFDCPEVEFIQLARPTLSLSKYLQQVGRGMRISEGKEAVTILDNVGLYQTFGLPTDERDWRQLFLGRQAGKGVHGKSEQPVIIRDGDGEKMLVNLEMVRIKRRGEKNDGVEIFMKDGRYGVLNDGKVTCAAEFEHIRRIKDSDYFAIATYPYAVFKGKTTVISLSGTDLRASLYGKVTPHGDVFEGKTINGQQTFWDGVGLRYYNTLPEFVRIGGVEMVCRNGKYLLRRQQGSQGEPVGKDDIWYNKYILWMKDTLFVKETGMAYTIAAYGIGCFYVVSNNAAQGRYLRIEIDGRISGDHIGYLGWVRTYDKPSWGRTKMIRASSGKMDYVDQDYARKINRVVVYHQD